MILTGDCVERMAEMAENSVDAIVTDPPYGLEFMGKEWDKLAKILPASEGYSRPGSRAKTSPMETWGNRPSGYVAGPPMQQFHARWATEALRVLKPGHYLLAFGGTRTVHRLTVALEDSGWIIRDMLIWAYASGFPKGRAQLKPAYEPIVLAKKPGPMVPLGIDAARIGYVSEADREQAIVPQPKTGPPERVYIFGKGAGRNGETFDPKGGRWPANLVLTDPLFDGDTPGVVGGGQTHSVEQPDYPRFLLIPKSSRSDREPNAYGRMVGELEERDVARLNARGDNPPDGIDPVSERFTARNRLNVHPTAKPVALMRHLVRLVTPTAVTQPDGSVTVGTVLDPFAGSGSTLLAAELEGFPWIGIEQDAEYVRIIEARLAGIQRGLGLDVAAPTPKYSGKAGDGKDWSDGPVHGHGGVTGFDGQKPTGQHYADEGTPSRFFMLPRDPLDDEAA